MSKSIFNFFKSTPAFLIYALVSIYLIINVIVLSWYLFEPEGFWGIVFFYLAITAGFMVTLQVLILCLAGIQDILKRKFDWRMALLAVVLLIVGSVVEFGPALWFHKKLADRYRYIDQSEAYLAQGRYEKALKNAEKYYQKNVINSSSIHPFFFMRYLYEESEHGKRAKNKAAYQALVNKAWCVHRIGEIDEAIVLYDSAYQMSKYILTESEEYKILPLLGLMQSYYTKNEILKAEEYYYAFQNLNHDLFNAADISNAVFTYFIYAYKSKQEGDLEGMADFYDKAFRLMNIHYGEINSEEHFITAIISCDNKIIKNEMNSADSLYNEIEHVADEFDDRESYLNYLDLATTYYTKNQDLELLEDYLNEKERFVRKRQGSSHPNYLKVLTDFNAYYLQIEQYDKALAYTKQVHEKAERIASKIPLKLSNHIDLVSGLTYYHNNQFDSAMALFGRVEHKIKDRLAQDFYFLTPQERESVMFNHQPAFDIINGIYARMNVTSANERIYDNLLFTKSLALESIKSLRKDLSEYGKYHIIDELDDIKNRRDKIEMDFLSGKTDDKSRSDLLDSIQKMERDIMVRISEIPGMKSNSINQVTWLGVRSALKEHEYALEYLYLPPSDENKTALYYALILGHHYNAPVLIQLPFTSKTQEEIARHADAMQENYKENIAVLKNCFIEPIKKIIGDSVSLYLAASGPLHSVSFSALCIDEPFEYHMVNSTRSIAKNVSTEDYPISSTALFGGISYGNKNQNDTNLSSLQKEVIRSGYQYLPMTKAEVEGIQRIMEKNQVNNALFEGERASETSFRKISGMKPDILHIATHGFYYPLDQSYRVNNLIFQKSSQNDYFDNPMLRSGLLFSGNINGSSLDKTKDGIVTAFDISQLDFSSTDLVVLSACETGIGEERGFEGIFGLQRAFQMAGARNLLTSLWKVPDQQTMELMIDFYAGYFEGLPLNEALKNAQLRLKRKHPEPYYWAGFKLVE